jgi:hypothetical protein
MSTQRHSIKRQVFELTVGRTLDAQRLQAEVSRIYRQRIVPLLDQYCSACSAPDRLHRIAVLELDLGQVALQHLEEMLVARISTQLSRQLVDHISAQEHHAGSLDTDPKSTSQLELFSLFVQTGSLPWWADIGQPHLLEDALQHLMQHAPGPLRRVLRELALDTGCLQRLAQHYGDASLATLWGVLAPALRGAVLPLLADLVAVVHMATLPTPGGPEQRRMCTWSTMLHLASRRGQDYREPFSFWRELFPRLAHAWQMTSAALLAALRQTLRQRPGPGYAALDVIVQRLDQVPPDGRDLATASLPALLARWQRSGGSLAVLGALLAPLVARVPAQEYGRWLAVLASLESHATPAGSGLREAAQDLQTLLQSLLTQPRLPPAAISEWRHEVEQRAATLPGVDVVQQLQQWLAEVVPEASLAVEPAADPPLDLRFSDADEVYIDNAGLVILWPFLERFFERLGLVTAQRFQDLPAVHRAVGLLQYLASADTSPPEYLLPLNKVLCGMALDAVWALDPPVTEAETEECHALLSAVIAHAPILHNMSLQGLRGTFLLCQGVLSARDGAWLLRVQRETYDVVLDRFPWSITWVKLPWMNTLLRVAW